MEKSKFRKIAIVLVLVVVTGLVFYSAQSPGKPPEYLTATVERTDIENAVLATGTLQGVKQVDVGAQVSGQLKSLKVKLGDKVKKGQWLAEIDPLIAQNALRQAQVNEENLMARRQATAAQLKDAKATYERYKVLQPDDAISKQEYETAESNYRVEAANLLSLDAQIKDARIQVETARVNLAYTHIVAPIDGYVVGIVTQEGQTVIAEQLAPVLLKLADLDTMTVKAQVSEADVIHIKPGQEVYFTILGEAEKRYYATLRGTEPAPQNFLETQTAGTPKQNTAVFYNSLFDVPNPDHRLRISMTAQVRIVLDKAKAVLTVPVAALGAKNQDGSYVVRVLDAEGKAQPRNVQTGINNNVRAEIKDGLAEGDKVVIGEPAPAVAGA
ncbi:MULTISPECIES: macrolide transporter subunit MacA [Pseudomonas]|uniref:macrolide transporter subunit MacA n=1 Tax=Pseudomonas TaxID=286 RepID=UPI000876D6EA|nr:MULTISPECIES: macrolide transporter subunit MacA [Pseudomonas]MDB6446367.1 macrolide transporter subunit MacA [Pseudomonas sp. 21TX0197]MDT8905853.1 macrolide transporter subunit MacA [Pseudomonas prosekii]NHN67949.1 macrolide transporter subunit MacA [Pseudomonas fluorescens]ROO34567.1 efflux transporter periplasmic adaptor subunit [Pseudomonas sp. AF76]ROO34722.1 efflux transporter periplasmic adaptor subunit [Pseudomonas sp. 7SR1]